MWDCLTKRISATLTGRRPTSRCASSKRVFSSFLILLAAIVHLGHPTGGSRASKVAGEGKYLFEFHHNVAYFFAKNFRQLYLPWFLKRELAWFVKERGSFQGEPGLVIRSLEGLWRGYWAGIRKRRQL